MKLAKALKEKNRLVGEVNRLKAIFTRENSRNAKASSKVDAGVVWMELQEATNKLISIKANIFKANSGIYSKIVRIGELKNMASWLPMLNTNNETSERWNGAAMEKIEMKAWMTLEDVDKQVVLFQKEIADLQDAIDEYNATVEVEA